LNPEAQDKAHVGVEQCPPTHSEGSMQGSRSEVTGAAQASPGFRFGAVQS
jgi:hypothetical protein